jgi:predicted ArsR family transcriptional regulator
MTGLTDKQRAEYFHRSYTAADGLWFMKAEESYGFEAALELDEAVWRILPKIQARMLKSMMNLDGGLEGLQQALSIRLAMEDFEFETKREGKSMQIIIGKCPWHNLMLKSGREHLSQKVSDLICHVENSVWASEFGKIAFKREERICRGDRICLMKFEEKIENVSGENENI